MKIKSLILRASLFMLIMFMFSSCGDLFENLNPAGNFKITSPGEATTAGSEMVYESPDNNYTLINSPAGSVYLWVGKTEVTYKQWKEVYDWASLNGYLIDNEGQAGSGTDFPSTHPVTTICLRDMMVWCNALTQYYNEHNGNETDYTYAYTYDGSPVKNSELSNTKVDDVYYDASATGFRVPLNEEWVYAASYPSTPDDYASGATDTYNNEAATSAVAWYDLSSNGQTHPVAQKLPNALGIYDMSGNVCELVFDKLAFYGTHHNNKGGAWNSNPVELSIGEHHPLTDHTNSYAVGFRIFRSAGN